MERHVFCAVSGGTDFVEAEETFLPESARERDNALRFLMQRFPLYCPHHLLHNLLNGHYNRHPLCNARPFHDDQCRHGSHSRPQLSEAERSITAPAAGVVIFLPFGLSYGTSSDNSASHFVRGCADCEFLYDGDTCGSCRRVWRDGRAVPAKGFTGCQGQYASQSRPLARECRPVRVRPACGS